MATYEEIVSALDSAVIAKQAVDTRKGEVSGAETAVSEAGTSLANAQAALTEANNELAQHEANVKRLIEEFFHPPGLSN